MVTLMMTQTAIPCMQIRGGTSKGAYFLAADLPDDPQLRDKVLVAAMGGPDNLQIDGVGGGHPLSSKVAIVSRSAREDAQVDYLFLQVSPTENLVSNVQNCGNILSGVGPYAIEKGLVPATDGETAVRVFMTNSGNVCELTVQTPGGNVEYEGAASIDGVPGTAAPIVCDYFDLAGSSCGALLPTGNSVDEFDGVEVTCIDNGMPVVIMLASDFGISGAESPEALDANEGLKRRVEGIRLQAGPAMDLGDVAGKSVPKMSLVSAPLHGGVINTRTFIPHNCHKSIGVLGAVTVATACILPESVAARLAAVPDGDEKLMDVEHPAGALQIRLLTGSSGGGTGVRRAGIIRTARVLFSGDVYIAKSVWDGRKSARRIAEAANA
jgi:4-oxalomesaconate tautomerase